MRKNWTMKALGKHCKVSSVLSCGTIRQFDTKSRRSTALKHGSPIHDRLCAGLDTSACQVLQKYERELVNAVPGRNFRLDIAYPALKLGIEVDGWQNHGKTKKGFQNDREKQNLYTEAGWRILRYTAADIYGNLDGVLAQISRVVDLMGHQPR